MQGDTWRCREMQGDAGRCKAMQGDAGRACRGWRGTGRRRGAGRGAERRAQRRPRGVQAACSAQARAARCGAVRRGAAWCGACGVCGVCGTWSVCWAAPGQGRASPPRLQRGGELGVGMRRGGGGRGRGRGRGVGGGRGDGQGSSAGRGSTDDDGSARSEDNERLDIAVLQRLDVCEYTREEGHRHPEEALVQRRHA